MPGSHPPAAISERLDARVASSLARKSPMLRSLLLFGLVLLPHPSTPASAQSLEPRLRDFDARLSRLRAEHRIPGLAAAIVKDRELAWSSGYGWAHDEVPVTPDTPFWIASLTKPLLGLLFLQLEADGRVDLQDRINDVPGRDGLCEWLSGSPLPFGRDLRCDAPITIDQILHHTVNGEPGTRFLYNPVMYSRLSRYIEHRYGSSVEEAEGRHNRMARLVEERILAPAGMRRTMSSMWQREKMDVFFDMAQGPGRDAPLALGMGRGGRLFGALPEGARTEPLAHPPGER
jgi:CubicO group peptidase (beta-lactamase class C family)